MGNAVFILGESGQGKTFSIRGLEPNTCKVISVRKGRLPFPEGKDYDVLCTNDYKTIWGEIQSSDKKIIVIDDSQFLMVDEYMKRGKEAGYNKFVDIGQHFSFLLDAVHNAPDDVIVYFLHHTQTTNDGRLKAKTVGQMLDNYLTLEATTDIVLYVQSDGKDYWFETQTNGVNTAKSPYGMFEARIPNDLGLVDKSIRSYWGLEVIGGK